MTSYNAWAYRRLGALLAAWLAAMPAAAQVNEKAYADYFLVGQFGEICTMCEVIVLCQAGDAGPDHPSVPDSGSFTLYHIQTRTFWSQVSTIWEWFVANFNSRNLATGHRRPVIILDVADGRWSAPVTGRLQISLEPPRLAMPDGREIDRTDRRWRQSAPPGDDLGYCQRLPLWDALDVIARHSTGGNQQ
jgi:hypothetical protein